jgi:hypothetical protein
MTNTRFLFRNLWRSGTLLACTSENPQFPMENTQDDVVALPWRTATGDDDAETVDADLGAAEEYDFVAILDHNLTSGATITVYGADDAAFTSNVVNDVLTYNGNNIFEFLAAARTKRYCRFKFEDGSNPDTYIQIGTLIVGKYVELSRPPVGQQVGPTDLTEMERTPAGSRIGTQDLQPFTLWRLPFAGLSDADALAIRSGLVEVGVKYNVVLCLDSSAPNTNSYWVNFSELAQPDRAHANFWTWEASMEEAL